MCVSIRARFIRRCAAAPSRAASMCTWAQSVSRTYLGSSVMSADVETPRLVPRDAADVAAIVAGAPGPLELIGCGWKRDIGKPPTGDLLDLRELAVIVSYESAELVLTAHAATPLEAIEGALARDSQRLAFEPPN